MGLFERKKSIPRLSTQSQTLVTAGESAVANSANKINVLFLKFVPPIIDVCFFVMYMIYILCLTH